LKAARADQIELNTQIKMGDYRRVTDIISLWVQNAAAVRSTLVSFPGAVRRLFGLSISQEVELDHLVDKKLIELQSLFEPQGVPPGRP
jgi:hypothetical protein